MKDAIDIKLRARDIRRNKRNIKKAYKINDQKHDYKDHLRRKQDTVEKEDYNEIMFWKTSTEI